MSRLSRRTALAAGAALLSGCGEGTWLGENPPPPLPGERKAVLLAEDKIAADPRLDALNVELPPPVLNPAWPQRGGSATRDMQHLAAADALKKAWSVDIGAGADSRTRLLSGPIVAGGRVYAVDADGMVTAVDAGDGKRIWQFYGKDVPQVDRLAGGGVAFEDGKLFLVNGNGMVYGLDANDGKELWRRPILSPIRTAPSIAAGKLLVPTADDQLYALDAASGEILWQHAGQFEQTGLLGGASPAVSGAIVVSAYASGEVIGLALDNGQPLWNEAVVRPRRTLAIGTIAGVRGDPVIDSGQVYVASVSGEMACFDLQTGNRLWSADLTTLHTPWIAGNYLFLLTERNELVCLVDQGGRIRWVTPMPARVEADKPDSRAINWVGPILVSQRLLLANSEGQVTSVSPLTGEILGSGEVGGAVSVPAAVAEGTVYYLTDGAELVAFR